MSLSTNGPEAEADWEVTPDGLSIAARHFLIRRGYCCANRCRNCPYVNWRTLPDWQPAPASTIQHIRVSPKTLADIRAHLTLHEQALVTAPADAWADHQEMIEHYRRLLEYWC